MLPTFLYSTVPTTKTEESSNTAGHQRRGKETTGLRQSGWQLSPWDTQGQIWPLEEHGQQWRALCWGMANANITAVTTGRAQHLWGDPASQISALTKTHPSQMVPLHHSETPQIPLRAPQQTNLQGGKVTCSHLEGFGAIHSYQAIREKSCAQADKASGKGRGPTAPALTPKLMCCLWGLQQIQTSL